MKAALFTGKDRFEIKECALPACPPDGLVVRVHACAICGTDLKILRCEDVKQEKGKLRSMKLPRITGHEFSGIVEDVAPGMEGFAKGDRVVVAPTVPCLGCMMCKRGDYEMCDNLRVIGYDWDGGFAEFVQIESAIVKGGCVVKVPAGVDMDTAALTEPLSCAISAFELSPLRKGGRVVVMGAGPLGCFLIELARVHGASQCILVDISKEQLEMARVCNADFYLDVAKVDLKEEISSLTNGQGVDLVITACASADAQRTGLDIVGKKGYVNLFGGLPRGRSFVSLDTNLIHYKECHLVGTHGSRPEQVRKALQLIGKGEIDLEKYITHRYPLNNINEAFAQAGKGNRLKILIKP